MTSRHPLTCFSIAVANKTNTTNTVIPDLSNPVLYVDEYAIHVGNHIYRATFPTVSSPPAGVFLNITGGRAFGYSVWLNSDFIGSYLGLSYLGAHAEEFSFDNATLADEGEQNVLVILMDNSGHDLREVALAPRGITNATLIGDAEDGYSFTEWKIAGTAGGGQGNIDPVRGVLNEGGLYAERVGMHLPGFPDDDWTALDDGVSTLDVLDAGVRSYRTTVDLDVPRGLDVSVSFKLSSPEERNNCRVLLFVNGYQYGRFNPYIGHQTQFPVPPGILDLYGTNTIMVSVWSQAAEGCEVDIDWNVDFAVSSSFDLGFDSSYLRPGWTEDRLEYA